MTTSAPHRLDATLCRLADGALGGPCPPATLLALSVLDAAMLVALAWAMCSLGSWVTIALACVLFASRAPSILARLRADVAATSRPGTVGRARAAREGESGRRRGALALLGIFCAIAAVVAVAYALDGEGGPQASALGVDPDALSAWRIVALPLSILCDALRLYAGCALAPPTGRSRSGGAA